MKPAVRQLLMGAQRVRTNIGTHIPSLSTQTATATALYAGLTINAGSQVTAHAAFEVETEYDAVRVILFNRSTVSTLSVSGATVTSGAALTTDALNDTAFTNTPTTVLFGGSAGTTIAAAVNTGGVLFDQPCISDWTPISSVARTDVVGARPAIHVRVLFTFPGGGTDPATYWNRSGTDWTTARTNSKGAVMSAFTIGDKLRAALGASVSATGNTPIFGVQYRAKTSVMTLMVVGDSISATASLTNRKERGWPIQSQMDVSTVAQPVEIIKCAQTGAAPSYYRQYAAALMPVLNPTHALFSGFSPNGLGATFTATDINTIRTHVTSFLDACKRNKALGGTWAISPSLWSGVPKNSSTAPNTAAFWDAASDNLRKAWIAEMRGMGIPFVDMNTTVADNGSPQLFQMTGNGWPADLVGTDGIHPNDAADALMQATFTTSLREIARAYFG